jgi:hypothetical protein
MLLTVFHLEKTSLLTLMTMILTMLLNQIWLELLLTQHSLKKTNFKLLNLIQLPAKDSKTLENNLSKTIWFD